MHVHQAERNSHGYSRKRYKGGGEERNTHLISLLCTNLSGSKRRKEDNHREHPVTCLLPIDSWLSQSAQALNGDCKHYYHFQKTAITSLFLRNVDHSVSPNKDQTNDPFNSFDRSHTHNFKVPWQLRWSLVTWLQHFLTWERKWKCARAPQIRTCIDPGWGCHDLQR